MKQKNLVLMVVAVGIGLVAAFLTSQIGAGTSSGPEMVPTLVAKTELPVGTLVDEKKFEQMVTVISFPADSLPPEVIRDENLVKGKRLTRTLRPGDKFMPQDLSDGASITPPEGKQWYTLKMDAVKAAAGFALPGNEVDLILTETLPDGTQRASVLFRKMLVLAVDILDRTPEGGKLAVPQLNSVSLAVTPREGAQLALAQKRGDISLMLRERDSEDVETIEPVVELPIDQKNPEDAAPAAAVMPATVALPVAREDIEPGTKITSTNFSELFTTREFVLPAPSSAVSQLNDLTGKFVVQTISKDQFVPETSLSSDAPEDAPAQAQNDPDPEPDVELIPTKQHILTIQDGSRRSTATYHSEGDGPYRLVDGDSIPRPIIAPAPARPAPQEAEPEAAPEVEPESADEPLPPLPLEEILS